MTRPLPLLALALAAAAAGCVPHIAPYQPRHRHFDPGEYAASHDVRGGSLYAGDGGFFDDGNANRVGDIVVIRIDEHESGSHDAVTKLDKQDDATYGMPAAIGLLAAIQKKYPDLDPSQLLSTSSSVKFAGSGSTERKGALTATLPVRVAQVLPNGDLYVEGNKVVMVGEEEHHLYISGIVRRIDIASDDSVPSSRIAEAEIEYTGRGDVSDQQRRGWLSRIVGRIWPW